jgi:hypothetical protein
VPHALATSLLSSRAGARFAREAVVPALERARDEIEARLRDLGVIA